MRPWWSGVCRRSVLILGVLSLPVQVAGGQPSAEESARVILEVVDVAGKVPLSSGGQFRLRPLDEERGEWLRVDAQADEDGADAASFRATARLPLGSRWRACLDFPGLWAPCKDLIAGQSEATRLEAWPSVKVAGRFLPIPAGTSPPERVILRFSAVRPPRRDGFTGIHVGCVFEERSWSCDVPALVLDLELRPAGFVPVYRFGVDLSSVERWDFGTVELQQGASLVARVETAGGEPLGSSARARLFPFAPGQENRRLRERMTRAVAEASVAESGFVQLAPVPPGVYSLEVTSPGYAPAVESPLEVWTRREVRLKDPVELERPLTLEVAVSPPLDWLDRPWHLQLSRASRLTGTYDDGPVFDGKLDETGQVRIAGQTPGTYMLQLIDSVGNPLFGAFDREITGPADAEILIDLDLLVVRGTLSYQDEPIRGRLWFGSRMGGVRSEMAADLQGSFSGVLPRAGWWPVEIDAPSVDATGYLTRVRVEPDSVGDAEVEIALPDTEVIGRVVDGESQSVAGAEVSIGTTDWGRRAVTDADGRFRFVAIEPGLAAVGARDRAGGAGRSSDVRQIRVAEEQPTPPLELVLRDLTTFRGRVVSERGPVPGAILLVGTWEPREAAGQETVRADSEGRFEVRLRADTRRIRAVVAPPGHALRAFELAAAESLELPVPTGGGTVTLHLEPSPDPNARHEAETWLLYQDGIGLSDRILYQWARGHGFAGIDPGTGVVEIPQLAPGHYRLCRLPTGLTVGWVEPTPVACSDDFLSPGGQLVLELPPARE